MEEAEIKKLIQKEVEERIRESITQHSIFPDTIKQRHISEGVRYIRSGTAANRPTSGEKTGAAYFSTDTNTLNMWNGTAWVQEILT